jgi:periplasmic protein CpxP/Spy
MQKEKGMEVSKRFWIGAIAVVLVCGCLAVAAQEASPAQSAPPATPNAGPERPAGGGRRTMEGFGELRNLSQQLNLTEEQKGKLRPILMEEGDQLRTTRLDEHLPLEQKRAKMMEIRDSFRPKIAALLTPEQQERWKKMQEEARQRWQEHQEQMKSAEPQSPPKPQ